MRSDVVFPRQVGSALRAFLRSEATGGVLLVGAAALAMIAANVPGLAAAYFDALHFETGPVLTPKLGAMSVHLWINDGLMAVFFLLVGLEVKREFVDGQLRSWSDRRLPVAAAAAGMIVPALVYLAIAGGDPALRRGWAIPAATDIAFALGALALLGGRAPASLKLFITTVAIFDDIGAIAIIALAYTDSLDARALAGAALVLAALYGFKRRRVQWLAPYLAGFVLLWLTILLSGVHATVAGVLTALMVPITPTPGTPDSASSPLHRLEHRLNPWVAYAIVPLFGFANAGVSFAGISWGDLLAPLPLGIAAGLVLGKQIGVFGAVWLAVRTGFAEKPARTSWLQIYGVALLCGIGFTMSLFIGELAFAGDDMAAAVKIGVLLGSLVSAFAGFLVLRFAPRERSIVAQRQEQPE